jgi:hypothetical protein
VSAARPPVDIDGPRWEDEACDLAHPPIDEDARSRTPDSKADR